MKVISAPLGGLLGAILGGVLWALYIKWTGNRWGFLAVGIGALTGIGIVFSGSQGFEVSDKKHWLMLSIGAAFFSIIGFYIGKFLDVQLNAITQIAEMMMQEYNLTMEEALPSARVQFSGYSRWELMKDRMDWYDALFVGIAALTGFYLTYHPRLRNLISNINKQRK